MTAQIFWARRPACCRKSDAVSFEDLPGAFLPCWSAEFERVPENLLHGKSPFVRVWAAGFLCALPPLDACLRYQCLACLSASWSISARLTVNQFFPCSAADGGSYDVINDASSPAAGDGCAQQSSARHNWEMNYQEAAIYLQVSPAGLYCVKMGFWSYGSSWQETKSFSLRLKNWRFAKEPARRVGGCWKHLQMGSGKSFGSDWTSCPPFPTSPNTIDSVRGVQHIFSSATLPWRFRWLVAGRRFIPSVAPGGMVSVLLRHLVFWNCRS